MRIYIIAINKSRTITALRAIIATAAVSRGPANASTFASFV